MTQTSSTRRTRYPGPIDQAKKHPHALVDQGSLTGIDLRPPIHDYLRAYRSGDPFVALGRMWVS